MLRGSQRRGGKLKGGSWRDALSVIGVSLALLAALTAALWGLKNIADVGTVTILYLIAVLFAAIRGGAVPAIVTTVAAVGATAFFFYPPIFDFRVHQAVHLIDLVLFIIVTAATGKLAIDVRKAKMREQADALREALIGSVSHELRTPLSTIIGSASVLAQSPDVANNPRLFPLVQGLREEADRLNEHIQNLLDATRISNEGIRPHEEWVDPGDVVNAAVDRKRRLLAGHKVSVEVAPDLPLLELDPTLIEKALGQVIENAAKYSPANSLIEIKAEQSGGMIRIAVQDRGAGMTHEERERIWERFYRSPRHGDNIPGSGLGLWIARALVTASNGHVEAWSAGVGDGSTVALYLPLPTGPVPEHVEAADE